MWWKVVLDMVSYNRDSVERWIFVLRKYSQPPQKEAAKKTGVYVEIAFSRKKRNEEQMRAVS